jgi:phytoene dehydrogenase-like protein
MKNIIIVGAGIAGLAAGIYALQSGFNATIYESHAIPGGASTSWRRGGYLFEGGMH